MFVTLRRNVDSLSIERRDFAPSHQACDNCRARKMRCSGQRNGCHRCLTRGLSCEYHVPASRSGRKRRSINSMETPDPAQFHSDSRISISSASQSTCRPQTRSSESPPKDSNANLAPQRTPRYKSSTDLQDTTHIVRMESHAPAASGFICDFVAPYAPTTEQRKLSVDNMCTSIRVTASDAGQEESASCTLFETAEPNRPSGKSSSSAIDEINTKPCQCVSSMLSLLAESEIEGERLSLRTVDQFLRLNKHGLARCNRVLGCQECCSSSNLVMLIVTICRAMVAQHERMYKILVHQYEKLQRLGRQTQPIWNRDLQVDAAEPASEAPSAPVLTMGIVALNDYEVDAFEEPCVFGGLATMQQRALLRFMAQLRLLCIKADWQTHCQMLVALEKRVKEQLERVRTYHENNEG